MIIVFNEKSMFFLILQWQSNKYYKMCREQISYLFCSIPTEVDDEVASCAWNIGSNPTLLLAVQSSSILTSIVCEDLRGWPGDWFNRIKKYIFPLCSFNHRCVTRSWNSEDKHELQVIIILGPV